MPDKATPDLWTQLKFDVSGENNNQNTERVFSSRVILIRVNPILAL